MEVEPKSTFLALTLSSGDPSSPDLSRVFSCNYCQRKFYSSQALGGHQNAHKLERSLAKRSREISMAIHSHGVPPSHPLAAAAGGRRGAGPITDAAPFSRTAEDRRCGGQTSAMSAVPRWFVGDGRLEAEEDLDLSLRL